jgi:protein-L-isoaspartate(D-aspartate) O-methyltransferase
MLMVLKYGIGITSFIGILIIIFMILGRNILSGGNDDDYDKERKSMVKRQIEDRGVKDKKVLEAFRKVERHKFVPEEYRNRAYGDYPLPIGSGQTISQPYIVAFMTEAIELKQSDKVLEVGTGSGYQAAILAELCDSVFTIEVFESLGESAKKLLKELGYYNVFVKIGDGYKGWKEHAPYDAIIVTCAPSNIPKPLTDQMNEGGRMIIPVGRQWTQELVLLRKVNGKIIEKDVLPVRFVPMIDSSGSKY